MVEWKGSWIWTDKSLPARNGFLRFRRTFAGKGPAKLHVTADSRYCLYVNGEYVGQGPVRSWPSHLKYDTYDLTPYLTKGTNVLAILVTHYGESTFQYIHGEPGLLAQLELGNEVVVTDSKWRVAPSYAFATNVSRITEHQGYEEQFDARLDDAWTTGNYDDSTWQPALETRPPLNSHHPTLEPRDIPLLTLEPVQPKRVVKTEVVESVQQTWTVYLKPYLAPGDVSANCVYAHAYMGTQVWAPEDTHARLIRPHHHAGPYKVNGEVVSSDEVLLHKGWNSLLYPYMGMRNRLHFVLCVDCPVPLKFCARGNQGGSPWAVFGPFELDQEGINRLAHQKDKSLIVSTPVSAEATAKACADLWQSGLLGDWVHHSFAQEVQEEYLAPVNVFAISYSDKTTGDQVHLDQPEAILSANNEWTTIYPATDGKAVRILLDYGQEVAGFHRFEIDAAAGTMLDVQNFEFIWPDGRYALDEGMNNSFRYTCRDGRQEYQTFVRRGFRYCYVTIRNQNGPVRLRTMELLYNSYPQTNQGSFTCSDARLDQIWQVGANTLRASTEDTYVDCPSFEQVLWVGDARNEALIDWVINGDPRLWFRCLELAGHSLDRSPLVESQVPSGWQDILPAWSFLWMRSCREYLMFTGDKQRSHVLLDFVQRNVAGIVEHLDEQGLFSIQGWNMFDWAPMDTPNHGVVTHQNCFAVLALNEAADLAQRLGEAQLATDWRSIADNLSIAINEHLWNDAHQAYTDCLRQKEHSKVYSQQTQTVAYIAGVAQNERRIRCREIMYNPPEGFVKAGSPFFEFFLLEALQQEGRPAEFIDIIRRDWGFMLDMGATAFWEMWSRAATRPTRSFCHGWSAAPTYFLSTYVMGIQPTAPGFAKTLVKPHPGDLKWCRGTMPTPYGNIKVNWEHGGDGLFRLDVQAPPQVSVEVKLPFTNSKVTVNGVDYQ